jgi:hypothetical protein
VGRIYAPRANDTVLVGQSADVLPITVPAGDEQVVLGIVCGVFRGVPQVEAIDPKAEVAA